MAHIIECELVKVVPVSIAIDGTALKPGLEFDTRRKCIVGLFENKSLRFVQENPLPKASEIKDNLVTSANVLYVTALDNGASMPVGVDYLPKRVSGEEIFKLIKNAVRTIQICKRCLLTLPSVEHIAEHSNSECCSSCEMCLQLKAVCPDCAQQGQVSYIPSLRACSRCLKDGVQCYRATVFVAVSDCESCNKKALLQINEMRKEGTIPIDISLLIALPDAVHLGKSLKCSWSNWYILLQGERSNLVLIRTLRDCNKPALRKKLRKLLSLDSVRNKDRMDYNTVVLLTRPEVVQAVEAIPLVVHTLMPEKYRFWKSNAAGLYPHPITITTGPIGKLFVIDHDQEKQCRLLELRLHNPVDVKVLVEKLDDARSICYSGGVCYIAERGAQGVRYIDIEGSVMLDVKGLRSKAAVIEELRKRRLSEHGTVAQLKTRLSNHLKGMLSNARRKDYVNVASDPLKKPSAICFATPGILICADDGARNIFHLCITLDGVSVQGEVTQTIPYPPDVTSVRDIAMVNNTNVFTAADRGMFQISLNSLEVLQVPGVAKPICVSSFDQGLIFTEELQVKSLNPIDWSVSNIAGSEAAGNADGPSDSASFTQLHGICSEGKNIFVTDLGTASVKLITGLSGTAEFLKNLGRLYDSFGIHTKGLVPDNMSISSAKISVQSVHSYIQSTVEGVKDKFDIGDRATNGPEGTVSAQTQESLSMLQEGLNTLEESLKNFPTYDLTDLDLSTLLTTMVENLHAVSHFKSETFSHLRYAVDFGTIFKESLKRATKWAAKYYTHPSSYYPVPECKMKFSDVTFMQPLPSVSMAKDDQTLMRECLEPFRPVRQRTVRSDTTKDKAGALPPSVYMSDPSTYSLYSLMSNAPEDTEKLPATNDMSETQWEQEEEYETDSESSESCDSADEEFPPTKDEMAMMRLREQTKSRSGRTLRASVRLDL